MTHASPTKPEQLAFDLPVRAARGRSDFLVGPSNEVAVAWIDRWPDWPAPWLALYGPEGAGKSHLAAVWAQKAGARSVACADLTVEAVPDLLDSGALALDLLDPAHVDQQALFHLINWTQEKGAWLLLTARPAPADWSVDNPHLISRLRAMPAADLGEPDDVLLEAVLAKLFRDRQVSVADATIRYISARMERSLGAAVRLVERLDRLALGEHRSITRALAARALSEHETE